jgi:hypothetical protein
MEVMTKLYNAGGVLTYAIRHIFVEKAGSHDSPGPAKIEHCNLSSPCLRLEQHTVASGLQPPHAMAATGHPGRVCTVRLLLSRPASF